MPVSHSRDLREKQFFSCPADRAGRRRHHQEQERKQRRDDDVHNARIPNHSTTPMTIKTMLIDRASPSMVISLRGMVVKKDSFILRVPS